MFTFEHGETEKFSHQKLVLPSSSNEPQGQDSLSQRRTRTRSQYSSSSSISSITNIQLENDYISKNSTFGLWRVNRFSRRQSSTTTTTTTTSTDNDDCLPTLKTTTTSLFVSNEDIGAEDKDELLNDANQCRLSSRLVKRQNKLINEQLLQQQQKQKKYQN
ncbi:unnamed protein product [Didymodactylos carnosus]|uniref:Uncharacterized protein n=1 Tax=Didymodactylos carnosus TaxID=1234261 RepID=A0A814TVX5_9BILA|nr:unnamed protein product [Didymodactylos carnosus]CAF3927075.1 unnamed protein product [Didymodactylos carnosus]